MWCRREDAIWNSGGDERTAALARLEKSFGAQLVEGERYGRARNPELAREQPRGWELRARGDATGEDRVADVRVHLMVERLIARRVERDEQARRAGHAPAGGARVGGGGGFVWHCLTVMFWHF